MGGIEDSGCARIRWQGEVVATIATALVLFLTASSTASATTVDPYLAEQAATVKPEFISFGVDASQLYERSSGEPFDFERPALKKLVSELAPAYIRYSGTKIESTFYDDSNLLDHNDEPEGYAYVLSRDEWVDALEFAAGAGLKVMASTSAGPGPRNPDMSWNPENARDLLERAIAEGHPPAAVQIGNEPNITIYGGWDFDAAGYGQTDYRRDVDDFLALKNELLPGATFVGPGPFFSTGTERPLFGAALGPDVSEIMASVGDRYDVVSYHQYPAFGESDKCKDLQPRLPADTLSGEFLDIPKGAFEYMKGLRDRDAPGKPLWIDESGNTACGGVEGYSDRFASTFYYLNSLGYLAQRGVEVVTRWTISGPQPYALIDDETLRPRTDYWAAVLWRRLMGQVSLTPAVTAPDPKVRVYSQCLPGATGGVTTLLLNTDRTTARNVGFADTGATGGSIYLLTGALDGDTVSLNGKPLAAAEDGTLPALDGAPLAGTSVSLPAASIAFVTMPGANAEACGGPKRPGGPHPGIGVTVKLGVPRQSLKRILRTGRIKTICKPSIAASCRVAATLPAGQARRIGLTPATRTKRLPIAGSTVNLPRPVARKVMLKIKPKILKRLRRAPRRFRPRIRIEATASGQGIAFDGHAKLLLRLRR